MDTSRWMQAGLGVVLALIFSSTIAAAQSVKVQTVTKYYSVSGSSPAQLARSMSRNGPYSRAHRARAWATASRDMRYQVFRKRRNGRCVVTGAAVRSKIEYRLPRVRNERRLTPRTRRTWRSMVGLLTKHERTHGRYYRQLAYRTQKALRRIRSARTCSEVDRRARVLVERLSEEDRLRNLRFDQRDRRNYSRMTRLTRRTS